MPFLRAAFGNNSNNTEHAKGVCVIGNMDDKFTAAEWLAIREFIRRDDETTKREIALLGL